MLAFDPASGAALGSVAISGGGATAQPAIADGRIYVVTDSGTLVAFQ